MKLLTAISALLLAPLTLALPEGAAEPTLVATEPYYHLKTRLRPDQPESKAKYDNLYLRAYHTGAGLNDAVFSPNKSQAIRGFFNHTDTVNGGGYQAFRLGNLEYSLQLAHVSNNAGWQPAEINGGLWAPVFRFNSSDLVMAISNSYSTGWLVCDWWHNMPQLFYRVPIWGDGVPAPSNCVDVDLVKEDL